jgi:hypothetical protein
VGHVHGLRFRAAHAYTAFQLLLSGNAIKALPDDIVFLTYATIK